MYSLGEGVSRDYVESASGTALPQTKVKHWVNSNSGECILWAAVLLIPEEAAPQFRDGRAPL